MAVEVERSRDILGYILKVELTGSLDRLGKG